jgi:hypothetical protein
LNRFRGLSKGQCTNPPIRFEEINGLAVGLVRRYPLITHSIRRGPLILKLITGFKNHDYMLAIRRSNMTDDVGAMIFLFGAIILPIVGVITLVLWMILHQREYSKKKKEGKNEEVSNKQVLISLLIAIIGVAGFLLAIDDIAAFLNN